MASTTTTIRHDGRFARTGHAELHPGEIAIGVIIGRTSEFFDFFVYAIASVLVFPKLVFPETNPLSGTLYSFAIFALAFVARPFGTPIFMAIDRAYGRGAKLGAAMFLLGASTVLIAFLPGYYEIGYISGLLLAVFQIGQGLALGGVWDGLASLLAMSAPEKQRGWYAMVPQLGAPLGLMLASGLFAYFVANLSAQDFFDWGWRYPFFVAFSISVVALFARLRIVGTPEYIRQFESHALDPAPVGDTIRHERRNIIIGAFAPMASFALFHMVTVFPLSWIFLFTSQPPDRFLIIQLLSAGIGVVAMVVSGVLADQFGRRTLLIVTSGAIAAFSGFAPQLLDGGDIGEGAFMTLGFILLGLSFGQASGAVASAFSKAYRYTGSAVTTDLAWLAGAAFAPFLALYVSSHFGLMSCGGYLLVGAIASLVALSNTPRTL